MKPITSKEQMYRLLSSGALGNTVPQWFSVSEWEAAPEARPYAMWGVRTLTPGGPCRLYCPREEVASTVADYEAGGHRTNISLMIDAVVRVTLFADIADTMYGRTVYGVEYPPQGASWRKLMPSEGRTWTGLRAKALLEKHLNPSSLADLEVLREQYPGHVVELSATAGSIGSIPGRNAVVWEVRIDSGEYEKGTWGYW